MECSYVSYQIDTIHYDTNKITKKIYTMENNNIVYHIYKNSYENNNVNCDINDNALLFKSVITDENGKILSFSPPNSIIFDNFIDVNPTLNENVIVNEIIEGTMINLFYDERIHSWEISTKSAVGGKYWYYRTQYTMNDEQTIGSPKQKTFRDMFMDALGESENVCSLNEHPVIQRLSKDHCYCFILQHPENHIVLTVNKPKLYLVAVHKIEENKVFSVPIKEYEKWDCFRENVFYFPKKCNYSNYEKLICDCGNIQNDYSFVGFMLIDQNKGFRSAMFNPTYESVKELRGNNPNLQYQYFCFKRMNKIKEFLRFFPFYTELFHHFYLQYDEFVTNVHQSYYSYYVKKNSSRISKKYFIHISKIHHNIYLPSLNSSEGKKIITRKVVQEYFDNMTPGEILHYLYYDKRKLDLEKNVILDSNIENHTL